MFNKNQLVKSYIKKIFNLDEQQVENILKKITVDDFAAIVDLSLKNEKNKVLDIFKNYDLDITLVENKKVNLNNKLYKSNLYNPENCIIDIAASVLIDESIVESVSIFSNLNFIEKEILKATLPDYMLEIYKNIDNRIYENFYIVNTYKSKDIDFIKEILKCE